MFAGGGAREPGVNVAGIEMGAYSGVGDWPEQAAINKGIARNAHRVTFVI